MEKLSHIDQVSVLTNILKLMNLHPSKMHDHGYTISLCSKKLESNTTNSTRLVTLQDS